MFTAQQSGEYSFCFSNDMSTFAEKVVDFEITVSPPAKARLALLTGADACVGGT